MITLEGCFNELPPIFRARNSGDKTWREGYLKYQKTRYSSRRVRNRLLYKQGDRNVIQKNATKRRRRYMENIFSKFLDARWRWTLLVIAMSFISTWFIFGVCWWVITYTHGDFEYTRRIMNGEVYNESFIPCVKEIRGFGSCFLFSFETQTTIGYGYFLITEECPEAIFTMGLQSLIGLFIETCMVGIVFAKMSRPKIRAQTILFSKKAVICHRDGVPCLMFRVGDMRKSHILEANVRAQIIRKKKTKEGEVLPLYQQELKMYADGGDDQLMLIWPTIIVHKIDRSSPLYALSAQDLLQESFEIVCMLEGVIESTNMIMQARSSYIPTEILWGHRFEHIVTIRKETNEYEVDYTLFDKTYPVDTQLCSAKQLDEIRAEIYSSDIEERRNLARLISGVGLLNPSSDNSVELNGPLYVSLS